MPRNRSGEAAGERKLTGGYLATRKRSNRTSDHLWAI